MDTYNLQIYQGQTFSLSLTLTSGNGSPMNLNGCSVSGYLKNRYGNADKLANLNVSVITPTSGIVSLNIPATGTAALPVNIGVYDVEMFNSGDGTTTKVLMGNAYIYPEATY